MVLLLSGKRSKDCRVSSNDFHHIGGWEFIRDRFSPKRILYDYPTVQNMICFMSYNKVIVRRSNLDFVSKSPRTINEFNTILAKNKEIGVTSILIDEITI
jgi:hypothetical protein